MLINAPDFWRENGFTARLLAPLGALYGVFADRRMTRSGVRAPLPTLAIGGLTCGGDGKTPLAILITKLLIEMGERPAFLTRGYGRSNLTVPPLFVDRNRHNAHQVGDESLLLAREAMTVVSSDRIAAAQLALRAGASVLVMDDGFQSRELEPDLSLLAVDPIYGVGNGLCLPAGPLRAPLASQLAHAEICIIINPGRRKREQPFYMEKNLSSPCGGHQVRLLKTQRKADYRFCRTCASGEIFFYIKTNWSGLYCSTSVFRSSFLYG